MGSIGAWIQLLAFAVPFFAVALLAYIVAMIIVLKVLRKVRAPIWMQRTAVVGFCVITLTPVLAPATIVAVPVPIIMLIVISAISGAWNELSYVVVEFWQFSIPSILTTLALATWIAATRIKPSKEDAIHVPSS